MQLPTWYENVHYRPFRVIDVALGLRKMEKELDTLTKEQILSWIKSHQRDVNEVYQTQLILQKRIRELGDNR